ncbi:MAG: Uma2 family endonuclease [Actinoplanes sp.]
MSTTTLDHLGPWNEVDFFAIGETTDRIELLDGSLLVSPAEGLRHQRLSMRLGIAMEGATSPAGLSIYRAMRVRLRPGRVVVPDLVVVADADADDFDADIIDHDQLVLVVEIVSAGSAGMDRLVKMQLYAAAGIGSYLLAEPESADEVSLRLFRLQGEHYVEHAAAKAGEVLSVDEPFPFVLDTAALLGR